MPVDKEYRKSPVESVKLKSHVHNDYWIKFEVEGRDIKVTMCHGRPNQTVTMSVYPDDLDELADALVELKE